MIFWLDTKVHKQYDYYDIYDELMNKINRDKYQNIIDNLK